jgi:molybdopterin-guanine dinucleotide biosynthesis protein A
MGTPKAVEELNGRPLVSYPLEAVAAAGLEPVVVAKADSDLPALDCRVVRDSASSFHPAAGILAAMDALGAPVVAVACDMPFVPAELIELLAALEAPVAVPRIGDRLQPLLARYERSIASKLERAVERSEALQDAIAALEPLIIEERELARFGEPNRIGFNVNDGADLAAAARLIRETGNSRAGIAPPG